MVVVIVVEHVVIGAVQVYGAVQMLFAHVEDIPVVVGQLVL